MMTALVLLLVAATSTPGQPTEQPRRHPGSEQRPSDADQELRRERADAAGRVTRW